MARIRVTHVAVVALALAAAFAGTAVPASAQDAGRWVTRKKMSPRLVYLPSALLGFEPMKQTRALPSWKVSASQSSNLPSSDGRPAVKETGVVEVRTGYNYKKDSDATLTIGDAQFRLFTDGGSAFARDTKTDKALVRAMIRGATMVVKGRSSRGTLTTDTYSLKGFTAAYKVINEACGVK